MYMDKKLKVLMLNGSPREKGNIALAFSEMEQVFKENNTGTTSMVGNRVKEAWTKKEDRL